MLFCVTFCAKRGPPFKFPNTANVIYASSCKALSEYVSNYEIHHDLSVSNGKLDRTSNILITALSDSVTLEAIKKSIKERNIKRAVK